MKNILYIFLLFVLMSDITFAGCAFGICNVDTILQTTGDTNIETSVKGIVNYFLGFVALIVIIFIVKGGFQIITASSDEEKVKNGRKTIIYSLVGLLIIFFAWTIIDAVYISAETI